jgi:CheY-like chemotaxis protein
MDVQMPIMDGLEATGVIRQKEKASGTHIPILAMTAHAMKGDRERCLEAGMDGYIPKPIRAKNLYETVEGATARVRGNQAEGDAINGGQETIDRNQVLELTGGNAETLKEVVDLFAAECPKLMERISDAIAKEDPAELQRAAHALKGSVQVFGAQRTAAGALRLETMGRDGNLHGAQEVYLALAHQIERLMPMLTDLLTS